MVRRIVRTVLIGSTIAYTGASCDDGTAPSEFAGTYRLERFEGMVLPAINRLTSADTMYVVSEHLLLGDDGDGAQAGTQRLVNAAAPQGTLWSWTRRVRYSERAGTIEIVFPCPPDADCVATPPLVGERVPGGIALAPRASSKPASIYRKVD